MIENINIKKPDYTYCESCGRVLHRTVIGRKTLIKTAVNVISDVKIFSMTCQCGHVSYFNPVDTN